MTSYLTPKQQRRKQLWPACSIALLATIQLILTFGIIGSETTSMILDFYHSMIFAGYFCSLFFMITWISMFTVTCCNRHSLCCVTHVLVENVLSIIAASVLLHFDNLFLNNPYTCLYGSDSSCNPDHSYYSSSDGIYNPTTYTIKLICIKVQLACASVMLVTNVIYIIIFIIVAVKTRNESNDNQMASYGRPEIYVSKQLPQSSTQWPSVPINNTMHVTSQYVVNEVQPPKSIQGPSVPISRPPEISEYEQSWRSKFPKLVVFILAIVQLVFTIIILILEIASLAILNYQPTGVGIWCAVPFLSACISTIILVRKKEASRIWATRVLIAQIILLVFTFILIGITGKFVQTGGYESSYTNSINIYDNNGYFTSYTTKYHLIQAQLAFGILLMFSVFIYVGIYIYVTYVGLWRCYHTLDTSHILWNSHILGREIERTF